MAEKLGDNAKTVGLVTVDGVVVLGKHVLKQVLPESVELAEALADQTKEFVVGSLLAATLDDHRW